MGWEQLPKSNGMKKYLILTMLYDQTNCTRMKRMENGLLRTAQPVLRRFPSVLLRDDRHRLGTVMRTSSWQGRSGQYALYT